MTSLVRSAYLGRARIHLPTENEGGEGENGVWFKDKEGIEKVSWLENGAEFRTRRGLRRRQCLRMEEGFVKEGGEWGVV